MLRTITKNGNQNLRQRKCTEKVESTSTAQILAMPIIGNQQTTVCDCE